MILLLTKASRRQRFLAFVYTVWFATPTSSCQSSISLIFKPAYPPALRRQQSHVGKH
jgi:hypothetical protein